MNETSQFRAKTCSSNMNSYAPSKTCNTMHKLVQDHPGSQHLQSKTNSDCQHIMQDASCQPKLYTEQKCSTMSTQNQFLHSFCAAFKSTRALVGRWVGPCHWETQWFWMLSRLSALKSPNPPKHEETSETEPTSGRDRNDIQGQRISVFWWQSTGSSERFKYGDM